MRRDISRGLRFHSRLPQETEVADPVDEPEVPRAERCAVAVLQAVAVNTVAINVHLDVWNFRSQHRREILIRPVRMHRIVDARTGDEGWRRIHGNRGIRIARERRGWGLTPVRGGSDPGPVGSDPGPVGSDPGPVGSDPGPVGSDPVRWGLTPVRWGLTPVGGV